MTTWGHLRALLLVAFVLLLAGCGGGGSAGVVSARAGAADIGTAGGSVDAVLEGGATVQLDIPAGALASTATWSIEPTTAPAGTLGSFTLSPAEIPLLKAVTLTVTLPAGQTLDPDTILLVDTGTQQIPVSAAIDLATRRIRVDLTLLGPAAPLASASPASAQRSRPLAFTPLGVTLLLASANTQQKLTMLEFLMADLVAAGSVENATLVQVAMNAVLGDPKIDSNARARTAIASWRSIVCGQQGFSVSALNTFNGVSVPTFAQLAGDVLQWDRFAQDLGGIVARVANPAEVGCANAPADFTQPVLSRLPTFLTGVSADLDLLDPNVDNDFTLLFKTRSAEIFNLGADLGAAGAVGLQDLANRVVTGQLDRSRNIAYSTCRSVRDQKLQAKLLLLLTTDPLLSNAASFGLVELWSDVQFCGMPLHWQVVDAGGTVMQQGDAGGIGPGFTTTAATLKVANAAKIVLSGPLAALICPVASQNNEQLAFSIGPLAGPVSSVQTLTPSGTNQYLQSGTQDFDVATLQSQGAEKLVVARQGGLCSGEFPGLITHNTLATFALDASIPVNPVQITAASLPATVVGGAYSTKLVATGGTSPFTWTASGLPAGLTLNSQSGLISGSVANPGAYAIGFGVSGADGSSANANLTLEVVANVAGVYAGTVTDNVFGGVNPVTRFVSQSGNLVKIGTAPDVFGSGIFFDLYELAPGGTLTYLGEAGVTFVADPIATANFGGTAIDAQVVGATLSYRLVDTGQVDGGVPGNDSYVLTRQ